MENSKSQLVDTINIPPKFDRILTSMKQISEKEEKPFTSSLCPEACCRNGWGWAEYTPPPSPPPYFPIYFLNHRYFLSTRRNRCSYPQCFLHVYKLAEPRIFAFKTTQPLFFSSVFPSRFLHVYNLAKPWIFPFKTTQPLLFSSMFPSCVQAN
jgi:hypothetical protein